MTWLKEYGAVAHLQVARAQSASLTVEGKREDYRQHLGIEQQLYSDLEGLLCRICSWLVY